MIIPFHTRTRKTHIYILATVIESSDVVCKSQPNPIFMYLSLPAHSHARICDRLLIRSVTSIVAHTHDAPRAHCTEPSHRSLWAVCGVKSGEFRMDCQCRVMIWMRIASSGLHNITGSPPHTKKATLGHIIKILIPKPQQYFFFLAL